MAVNKTVKYTELSDEVFWKLAGRLAIDFTPGIYRCKKCGYPVIDGYCCTHCGDSDPSSIERRGGLLSNDSK